MAEKTEKATPKKLRDARKKGQVAKSQDFPSAFTFVIFIFATLFSTGYLFKKLSGFILEMFSLIGTNVNLGNIAWDEVIPLETLRIGLRGDTFHDFLNK